MTSAFGKILRELVHAIPGAEGAVFVDWEGEAVDQYSTSEVDVRLLGAHWAICYYQARTALSKAGLDGPAELVLCFHRQQIVLRRVTEEYLVLLALRREANLGLALRQIDLAEHRLRGQM